MGHGMDTKRCAYWHHVVALGHSKHVVLRHTFPGCHMTVLGHGWCTNKRVHAAIWQHWDTACVEISEPSMPWCSDTAVV